MRHSTTVLTPLIMCWRNPRPLNKTPKLLSLTERHLRLMEMRLQLIL